MRCRIFIGTDNATQIPAKVLRYSICKQKPSMDVEFVDMPVTNTRLKALGKTGFSFERFMIPEHIQYQGKAIYLDADQLVFGDIANLWNMDKTCPNQDTATWCVYRGKRCATSVMLIDGNKAKGNMPNTNEIENSMTTLQGREKSKFYRQLMRGKQFKHAPQQINNSWNHMDIFVPGQTQLLHYTDLRRQPWRASNHHLGQLWLDYLRQAIEAGFVSKAEVEDACAQFSGYELGPDAKGVNPYVLSHLN